MSRVPLFALAVLAAAVLAAGCRDGSDAGTSGSEIRDTFRSSPPETYAYDCDDGTRMTARFENASGRDEVLLTLPDRTVRLPLVPAASGARYSDGETTWWGKGAAEARLEHADGRSCRCRLAPERSTTEQ
jgi:membrane-bound inhibitor of C-type lysozyme